MGGKRNQAQRTKNNVKPSSSSRSADLLGKDASKLVGFVALKQNVFALKTDSLLEDAESIDPNFQVALKKLSKKDAITKQKGLQELRELCKTSGTDGCKSILPYWCQLYNALALDVDNKVREWTQLAHKAVVSNVGRNLAPFLRHITPVWFISQYDTYPPTASAASTTFQSTFPNNKMKDVISFCRGEIFNFLFENLLNQTPQTLSKSDASKEDMDAKYERVIICCLNGYAQFIEKSLPSETFESINQKLTGSSKFWKYATHKAPLIRAAWYGTLVSLCKNSPLLMKNESKNVAKAVFSNLDESDPLVLPIVWEAALHILVVLKDCEHISIEKVIFPKLCNILEKGGQGNATTIYPNLLPFLSNISENISMDSLLFYDTFFQSLCAGLKEKSVKLSRSESDTVITTFMECFRYVIMLFAQDREFCLHILDNHLILLLKNSMLDLSFKSEIPSIYHGTAELITYWQRSIPSYPIYNCLLNRYWSAVCEMCLNSLKESLTDRALTSYIMFCQLKYLDSFLKPACKPKKILKVKFMSDCVEENETDCTKNDQISKLDPCVKRNLDNLCSELIKMYYLYTEHSSKDLINSTVDQLSSVVKLFGFHFFIESTGTNQIQFCSKLHEWLKDSGVPVEPVLVLTFSALSFITDEALKESLLQDLIQVRPESLVIEAVKLCMNKKVDHDEIRSWLKSSNVRKVLLSFVEGDFTKTDRSFEVLKFCLSAHRGPDYIIGNETFAIVLNSICNKLTNVSLLTSTVQLLENSFIEETTQFYKDYSNEIFNFLKVSFSVLLKTNSAVLLNLWKKTIFCVLGVFSTNSDEFKEFLDSCADITVNCLNESDDKNQSFVQNMGLVAYYLIESSSSRSGIKSKCATVLSVCCEFLTLINSKGRDMWQTDIEDVCLVAEMVYGNVPFTDSRPNQIENENDGLMWDPLKRVNLLSCSQSVVLSLELVLCLLGENTFHVENESDTEALLTNGDLAHLQSHLVHYVHSLTLMRSVSHYYSSVVQFLKSSELVECVAAVLKDLIQRLSESSKEELCSLLDSRLSMGNLWAQTREIVIKEFLEKDVKEAQGENERIITETLDANAIRSLRFKLKDKEKDYDTHISFMCWKFTTTCKTEASALFNICLANVGLMDLNNSAEIARFFTDLIQHKDNKICAKTWDFIILSTASWVHSISKTTTVQYYKEYVGFVVAVCDLFITFCSYLHNDNIPDSVLKIKKEWDDIFASDIYSILLQSWKYYADKCSSSSMDPASLLLIEKLSKSVCFIIKHGELPLNKTQGLITWTKDSSRLLLSSCPSVQVTSFLLLQSLAGSLAKSDLGLDENSTDKLSCLHLSDTLIKTETVTLAMLQDFKLGVMCLVEPFTDSYIYTRAYLMIWLVLLEIFKAADSQTRHLYTLWIKQGDLLNHFMNCLLHLLPDLIILGPEPNSKKNQEIFSSVPSFSFRGWTSEKLAQVSCWAYCNVLRVLPLLSRQWYSQSDPRTRDFVDKFTASFVTPILINEEISHAKTEEKSFENLTIETLPSARVVNAIYTLEESKTELIIQLAPNHPFTPPKVDISKSVVSSNQTKQKLKQLTLFPTLQNGCLWDYIIVWKNYLDKKFEGVEDCYICYSVLHYGTHQLPKLTCRTCKKKFHSACLYKWFTSSNKSTCPICRNLF